MELTAQRIIYTPINGWRERSDHIYIPSDAKWSYSIGDGPERARKKMLLLQDHLIQLIISFPIVFDLLEAKCYLKDNDLKNICYEHNYDYEKLIANLKELEAIFSVAYRKVRYIDKILFVDAEKLVYEIKIELKKATCKLEFYVYLTYGTLPLQIYNMYEAYSLIWNREKSHSDFGYYGYTYCSLIFELFVGIYRQLCELEFEIYDLAIDCDKYSNILVRAILTILLQEGDAWFFRIVPDEQIGIWDIEYGKNFELVVIEMISNASRKRIDTLFEEIREDVTKILADNNNDEVGEKVVTDYRKMRDALCVRVDPRLSANYW